jgi:enoyl-CoA hydratase
MSSFVRQATKDGVLLLTIDRPESKNAMHAPLRDQLCEAFAQADDDDTVRAVVLTGVDPVFSAGVDFKLHDHPPAAEAAKLMNPAKALRAMRTPVICAVNGACVSGALEVALSASFIVASERARFADTHAKLGVVATWGLTALLPRAVGVRRARELSATGRFIDADEALSIGLVNHVVAHEQLLAYALELADQIPANAAVGDVLNLYERGQDLTLAESLALETETSLTRVFDRSAFTAAGRALSTHNREDHQ